MMTHPKTAGFAHPHRNAGALGIEPGMAVADFGSGSGAYVFAMAERMGGHGHIYAIDVQRELLRRIKNEAHRRGIGNVEIIWSDLERPGGSHIADAHIDLVLVSNLLFQVEEKDIVLAEAWRILKTGGRLAIIDWSESFGGMGPHKKDVIQKESAVSRATMCGFSLDSEFDAGAHHYGLLFVKRPDAV